MELLEVQDRLKLEGCIVLGNIPERSAVLYDQSADREIATVQDGVLEVFE